MTDYRQNIKKILSENNGIVTAEQVSDYGIPRRCLSEMAGAGTIIKVARGIYALQEVWEDEMFLLQYRFSKGIFSHETALYLHGMTDRTPHRYIMTFPHGYNTGNAKKQNITAKTVIPRLYELGLTDVISPAGNTLKVYDIERTLCDIIKNKSDIQIINPAMKAYATSNGKDISKLIGYAEQLRVKAKILTYMEVLL
ncbi:MAG: type IV toxin-antitoxin system AbiEi family antitoxin domain-containing protein [Eubacteriales bacterium]|nr:type IV toxin-antitoxin system AbiEi family antitoxin domain-containing protein [Eubacteriales bacterium]